MDHWGQLAELKLEIISRCPLSCVHCSSESSPACNQIVDPKLIEPLAAELASLGGSQVRLSGGEPLEHPDLINILQIFIKHKITALLYTTGIRNRQSLTTISHAEATELKSNLQKIVFSIQGGSASIHDTFTGVSGSFDATIESISTCQAAGIEIAFHFVPTKANYQSLPQLVSLAKTLGIQSISLLRFVPHGRGAFSADSLSLAGDQLLDFRNMIMHLSDQGVHLRLGSPFRILNAGDVPACGAGIDRMLVSPNGTAYPCDAFKGFPVNEYLNVYELGLQKVWQESEFFKSIRGIVKTLPAECFGCHYAATCHGGCPAQRAFAAMSLDNTHPDPCCLNAQVSTDGACT